MKQNKQSDFIYAEAFEHCDKTYVRYRTKIDLNWKFLQNDSIDASADFDDSAWRLLNLPHDWSIEGEYNQSNPAGGSGGYLPTGIGWYRKVLLIPSEWRKGRRLYLAFDGVFTNSTVYVDGVKVGNREYGWLSFVCDITHVAREKDSVTVAVKVDNSVQPASRWDLISDRDGLLYLVNRACGRVLTFDGTALALSDGETDGNAQWQRAGEAEFYDYLVHAATGKILVVKDDGTLDMDLRERYDDSDMITNRAYWRFSTESTGD